MNHHIAFITYETPFAPAGGIAAVMSYLPQAIQNESKIPTYVITPFHSKIEKTIRLLPELEILGTVNLPFEGTDYSVEILLLQKEVSWIFIRQIDSSLLPNKFFLGKRHPYDIHAVDSNSQSSLFRDSLFFGQAASKVLEKICSKCSWTVLMHDWEALTTVFYLNQPSGRKNDKHPFLALHNGYDCGISQDFFRDAGLEKIQTKDSTVLSTGLPLVNDPVFTVSEQFALDLSNEIYQTEVMIPHLVNQLSPRLFGINNGVFIDQQVPDDIFQAGIERDFEPLMKWKEGNRKLALEQIERFSPSPGEPIWGDRSVFLNTELPWLIMAGRDDSRQKGYELACLAAEEFLKSGGQACFLFFPIPGDEGIDGIQFIKDLALKFPGYILGFPFLFREGYFPILRGATFGMMPSYYEPFGMANEFFLNGVSCIGRATGGIVQQIVPHRQVNSFSTAAANRAANWHPPGKPATGFLFREPDGIPSALLDWQIINRADYSFGSSETNRLAQRQELPLIQAMVNQMKMCIGDGVNFYNESFELYLKSIIDGISYINENFSWRKASREYINKIFKEEM